MKTVELAEATSDLAKYLPRDKETVVIRNHGKAVAALMKIDDDDVEDIALSENPEFLALLERSRKQARNGQVFTFDEVCKKYGIVPKNKRKKKN